MSYGTQARILLEKLDPAERGRRKPKLLCTTEERGIIAAEDEARTLGDALRPRWEYYQELYLSTDLSRMVRDIVDAIPQVVCIRREGGLYFVPRSQHAQLVQLQSLIERLPTDGSAEPYCMVIGLPDLCWVIFPGSSSPNVRLTAPGPVPTLTRVLPSWLLT